MAITDWMMPEVDGVELNAPHPHSAAGGYTYVLLLTASTGNAALVGRHGRGADDFMVKPFQVEELRARLRAASSVLQLESDLAEHNRRLAEANAAARRDLESAAVMQKALLPAPELEVTTLASRVALPAREPRRRRRLQRASRGRATRARSHLLDVAGHGAPSAMLSFTLSKLLAPALARDGRLVKRVADNARSWKPRRPRKCCVN